MAFLCVCACVCVVVSAAGTVHRIPYRCNRAAIFVSDQYHESQPFVFAAGYAQRRVNLTLLFGDRWRAEGAVADEPALGPAAAGADLWDVFD